MDSALVQTGPSTYSLYTLKLIKNHYTICGNQRGEVIGKRVKVKDRRKCKGIIMEGFEWEDAKRGEK